MNKILLRGRLKGDQIRHLSRLLNMQYTPTEIAREIGCTRRQFYRVYLPAGSPSIREDNGRIWINGTEFRNWYLNTYNKVKLAADEVYCLCCKQIVPLTSPIEMQKGHYRYWSAICPVCNRKVSKALSNKRGVNDQP